MRSDAIVFAIGVYNSIKDDGDTVIFIYDNYYIYAEDGIVTAVQKLK